MTTIHYDPRYLFWIWLGLVAVCAMAILAGILGYQTWKEFRYFKRAEKQLSRRC